MTIKKVVDHTYRTERERFLRQLKLPAGAEPDEDTKQKAHEHALEVVYDAGRAVGRRER